MTLAPHPLRTAAALVALGGLALAASADAQELRNVPRNRTLISQGWDFYNQVPAPTNFSPYAGVLLHQRNSLHYTVNEMLFYSDPNTNAVIPWQGDSYSYNADHTELTVKLKDGVKWSDGARFTADDVVFTITMLKAVAPDLVMSSAIKEWVADATAVDPLTVRIKLTKPGPRWAQDTLATGQAARFVVVPKHIWEGKDPKSFNNFDLAKGWPVGTGPYKVVKSDSASIVFDRLDTWWALGAGRVKALPAIERVVYRPATVEALPQLFANNDLDIGRALQIGNFEAASARNKGLISWNASGPVWGAPDGCTFRMVFNAQKAPYDDATVRRAFNFALDRGQIVDLAYEKSLPTATMPFSSYGGMKAYSEQLKDLTEKYALAKHDPKQTEALLASKGFAKGANGKWAKPGGAAWPVTLMVEQGNPAGPVIAQQLQAAGFDAVFQATQAAAFSDALSTGNFETALFVHCGSAYDPWQTLEHFHSKYAPPPGQKAGNIRAPTRYANKELDALLDKMEAMEPSAKNADYVKLVRQASEIVMRDMPEINYAEEYHVVTFNATYWKGYPSAGDPYIAPYLPWEGFNLIVHRLQPAK